MNIDVRGEAGSDTAARILDFISTGLPCLLPALAAFLSRCACDALKRNVGQNCRCLPLKLWTHSLGLEEVVPVGRLHRGGVATMDCL